MPSGIDLLEPKFRTGTGLIETQPLPAPTNLPKTPYDDLMREASIKSKVPYDILYRLIKRESSFNPKAENPESSAKGLGQFIDTTAEEMGITDPFDPKQSIDAAAAYLRKNYDRFGDWRKAIAAYYSGPSAVIKSEGLPSNLPKGYIESIFPTAKAELASLASAKSGLELLEPPKPAEPAIPEPLPSDQMAEKRNIPRGIWYPSAMAIMAKKGFGEQPPGGWDELGRPLDDEGKPIIYEKVNPSLVGSVIADTLKGLSGFATQPMETVRGGLDFILSIPAFLTGIVGAVGRGSAKLIEQMAAIPSKEPTKDQKELFLRTAVPGYEVTRFLNLNEVTRFLNLNEVYDTMAEAMQESFEFFQPGKELITGKPTKTSQMVGEVAMAPLNTISATGYEISELGIFDDYPNVKGAIRIIADAVALIGTGMLIKGRSRRAEFARGMEEVVNEAKGIADKEIEISKYPDAIARNIQQKVLEIEKQRLETKAKKYAEKLGDDISIVEEMGRMAEEKAKAEVMPVAETGLKAPPTDYTFTSKKGNVYNKIDNVWYDSKGEKVTNKFKLKALEEGKTPAKVVGKRVTKRKIIREVPGATEDIAHGVLDTRDIASIHKSGLKSGTSVGGQAMEHPIILIMEPGKAKPKDVPHRPGDQITTGKTGKIKEIWLDRDEFIETRAEEAVMKDILDVGESLGYTPEQLGGFTIRSPQVRENPRLRGLYMEWESSQKYGPSGGWRKYLDDIVEATEGKVPVKVFRTDIDVDPPKKIFTGEGHKVGKPTKAITIEKAPPVVGVPKGDLILTKEDIAVDILKYDDRIRKAQESIRRTKDPKKIKKLEREIEHVETLKGYAVDALKEAMTEVATEIDRQTGTETRLDSDVDLFMESKERTDFLHRAFEKNKKSVREDVEVYAQKLINDVRRWYYGNNDIDINAVRDQLNNIASRSAELREQFLTGVDHFQFMENVSEAANWASRLTRPAEVSGGVRLDMMIPIDQFPQLVKKTLEDIFKATRINADKIYRNRELFFRTGFWLGKDGKWRYEIDDSKAKLIMSPKKLLELTQEHRFVALEEVLSHEGIYNTFPDLRQTRIKLNPDNKVHAELTPEGNINLYYNVSERYGLVKYDNYMMDNILHELQHAINDKVGAFSGSTVAQEGVNLSIELLKSVKRDLKSSEIGRQNYVDTIVEIDEAIRTLNSGEVEAFASIVLPSLEIRFSRLGISSALDKVFEVTRQDAYRRYREVPGEMESRLTEERRSLTQEQRDRIPPWITLDRMLRKEGYDFEGHEQGIKLYSGIPIDEAAKQVVAGARKVAEYTKYARGLKKFKPSVAAKMLREEFNRSFVDRSGNIRNELLDKLGDEGYKIIQKMYLSKGASSLSANMLRQMRKEVYAGLIRREKKILDDIILDDRMIDIGKYKSEKEFKHPQGLKLQDFVAHRELFPQLEKLSQEKALDLDRRARTYSEWMKKPLKDMLDAGLISTEEYNALYPHNYRRIKLVDIYDKKNVIKVGKRKRTVYDSGVEPLARGRETDIYEPSSEVMALEVFNRAYGRILNNRANRTLLELAERDPQNPFARVKIKGGDKIPSGWSRIFVYEDGNRRAIYISPELSKEWITSSPEMTYRTSQIIRFASLSPVLRTFATGIDWGFALANLSRDIMHSWYTARAFEGGKWKGVYSSHLPVFIPQMAADLSRVFYDAAAKKGRYTDYINEGGGMEFLVHQGRLFQRGRHIEGPIDSIYDFMGYFGETSEIMTRLAIRDRVIRRRAREQGISIEEARRNKDITTEATFAARDYMDFGQGGGVAKVVDNGLPYLNAAIQGSRGLIRSFKPGSGTAMVSTYKLAQFASVVVGIYLASRTHAPKTHEALKGDISMQNNLCVPLGDGFGFEDEYGQMRYPYWKVPLDPGQKFFKKFFEESTNKVLGESVDVNAVVDSLKELSPAGVSELPPSISGTLGYVTNKDFWMNEDIWRQTDKPFRYPRSREEYIPGETPQAYIDIGKVTGLSPERTKYAVEELVTSNSLWAALVGKGYEELFGDMPKSKRQEHLALVLSRTPVVKRFFGVTNPYSKYATKFQEAEEKSVVERFIQSRELDSLVERYLYEDTASRQDVIRYMSSFKDKDVYDRLKERFQWEEAIQDVVEKSFWRRMKGLNVDAKAEMFYNELVSRSEEERKMLWNDYGIVVRAGGIASDDFRKRVQALRGTKR